MAIDQGVGLQDGMRVAELRAEGHLRRDPREVLQEVLADQPGVPGGPAGHDVAPFHLAEQRLVDAAQLRGPFRAHDPAAERVVNGSRAARRSP